MPHLAEIEQKSGRRRGPRFQASHLSVDMTFEDSSGGVLHATGRLKDVGARGFACILTEELPTTIKSVRAKVMSEAVRYEGECELRWRADGGRQYGFSFEAPEPDWWDMIKEMQKQHQWDESFDRRRAGRQKPRQN